MDTKKSRPCKFDGKFCPKCQLPFRLLKIKTSAHHVSNCWKTKKAERACPDGKNCVSEMAMHYTLYSHRELAKHRCTDTVLSEKKNNENLLHGSSMPSSSSVPSSLMETIYLSDSQTSSEEFLNHGTQRKKMLTQSKLALSSIKTETKSPMKKFTGKQNHDTKVRSHPVATDIPDISINLDNSNERRSSRKIQDIKPPVNVQKGKKNLCSSCLVNKSKNTRTKITATKKIKTEIPISINPWSIAASQKSFCDDKKEILIDVIDLTDDHGSSLVQEEDKESPLYPSKRRKLDSDRTSSTKSSNKDNGGETPTAKGLTDVDASHNRNVAMKNRNRKAKHADSSRSGLSSLSKKRSNNSPDKFTSSKSISKDIGSAKKKAKNTSEDSIKVKNRKEQNEKKSLLPNHKSASIISSKTSKKHDLNSTDFPLNSTQKENVNVGRIDFDSLETQDSEDWEVQLPKGPGFVPLSPINWPSSVHYDNSDQKPFVVLEKAGSTRQTSSLQDLFIDLAATSSSDRGDESYCMGWDSQIAGNIVPETKGNVGGNVPCDNGKDAEKNRSAKPKDKSVGIGISDIMSKNLFGHDGVDLLDGDSDMDGNIDDSCLLSDSEETLLAVGGNLHVSICSPQENKSMLSKDGKNGKDGNANIVKLKRNAQPKSDGTKNGTQPSISHTSDNEDSSNGGQNITLPFVSPTEKRKKESEMDEKVEQPSISPKMNEVPEDNGKNSSIGEISAEDFKTCKAWIKNKDNKENLEDSYDYLLEDSLLAGFPDDMDFPDQPTDSGVSSGSMPYPNADITSPKISKDHKTKDQSNFSNLNHEPDHRIKSSSIKNQPVPRSTAVNSPQKSFELNKPNGVRKNKQGDIGVMLLGHKPKPKEPPKKAYTYNYNESNKRSCPFYKKIGGSDIAVDAFSYETIVGISFYFLSHFHYDHYIGLTKHWKHNVYCSEVTGNLVKLKIRLSDHLIIKLPMNEEVLVGNVKVTLLEANHCPGAVLFLFKLRNNCVVLHTGDFRAHPSMESYPSLRGCKVSTLHLDTTYLNPNYSFPGQSEVIEAAVSIAKSAVEKNNKTLFVVGTYTIGKERIFTAIAEAIQSKIFVLQEKYRVLQCMMDKELNEMLTRKPSEARVHVVTMANLNKKTFMQNYLEKHDSFDRLIAIKPTGWTHSKTDTRLLQIKPVLYGNVSIYGLPYSEHSSFKDLERFVRFLKPKKILPTVNVSSKESREEMYRFLNEWKMRT